MEADKRLKQAISKKSKKGIAKSLKQNRMEEKYKELLEKFLEAMEVYNATGFDDTLQELAEEVAENID